MTKREQEILEYIRENPFISQQAIAQKADITRSSVAVHIRNLTKKGLIKGRAYVLADDMYVLCIGNVSVNISGNVSYELDPKALNVERATGQVKEQLSGMARNVAEYLMRSGVAAEIISVIPGSVFGDRILKSFREIQISPDNLFYSKSDRSSIELSIVTKNSEEILMNDTRIMEELTSDMIDEKAELISGAKFVFVDDSLSEATLQHLLKAYDSKFYVGINSNTGILKFKNVLNRIDSLVLTTEQATLILDENIVRYRDVRKAAADLYEMGVSNVYLTMPGGGVYFFSEQMNGKISEILSEDGSRIGLGEAFAAGILTADMHKDSTRVSAQMGSAYVKIVSETSSVFCNEFDSEQVERVLLRYFD